MPQDVIPQIAQRYQVPEPIVRELYRQLQATGGRQCQLSCPEFGGQAQWMPGMVLVSRPTDHQLRARVDGLCSELAAIVQGSDTSAPAALNREAGTAPASGCVSLPAGESWWPASFGHPAASGDQNGIRYAYFPQYQRLLLQQGARIDAYDTGDLQITGAGRQQGNAHTLTFSTDRGPIDVKKLKCVPLA
jgi:hypothetical protein